MELEFLSTLRIYYKNNSLKSQLEFKVKLTENKSYYVYLLFT
jgi:hypothetical protein